MQVSIKGADRKLGNLLRKACKFYGNELMHGNLSKHVSIKILHHNKSKEYPDKGSCKYLCAKYFTLDNIGRNHYATYITIHC